MFSRMSSHELFGSDVFIMKSFCAYHLRAHHSRAHFSAYKTKWQVRNPCHRCQYEVTVELYITYLHKNSFVSVQYLHRYNSHAHVNLPSAKGMLTPISYSCVLSSKCFGLTLIVTFFLTFLYPGRAFLREILPGKRGLIPQITVHALFLLY